MTNQEWYNIRNNHELQHSVGQRKNHKYIARIADSTGKKFRYFYDQAELAAYNASVDARDTAKKAYKSFDKATDYVAKELYKRQKKTTVKDKIIDAAVKVGDTVNNISKNKNSLVNTISPSAEKAYRQKQVHKQNETVKKLAKSNKHTIAAYLAKGKVAVDKFLTKISSQDNRITITTSKGNTYTMDELRKKNKKK